MQQETSTTVADILNQQEESILEEWVSLQLRAAGRRLSPADERALRANSGDFLTAFAHAARNDGFADLNSAQWLGVRDVLKRVSSSRAREGFSPMETATFIFSLKEPLFARLSREISDSRALMD